MKRIADVVLLVFTFLLIACGSSSTKGTIPAVTPSQSMPVPADLRDYRYCELIPVFQQGRNFHVDVYYAMGSSDCPADLWAKVDAAALKEQFGTVAMKVNGLRHWVMNILVGGNATAAGKVVDFGGIKMTQRTVLRTSIWQGTMGDKFFSPNEVTRTTVFVYLKGNMVHALTAPNGDVYCMQSYTQIVDPTLTIADLETLGARLDLPDGRTYQARVLTEDSELKADGLAYVINDYLYNSYQRVTPW